jgi:hypothetical protein
MSPRACSSSQLNHLTKPMFQNDSNATTTSTINNEHGLFNGNTTEINRHFFEKHRNQQVSLKVVYNCMCNKTCIESHLNDQQQESQQNDPNQIDKLAKIACSHDSWKSCQSHINSIMQRSLQSTTCFKCKKIIENENYHIHLKTAHNLVKILVCPLCGVLNE